MNVGVPGLGQMGQGAFHILHHNDPYHPSYHYGTGTTRGGLIGIASDYKLQFYGAEDIPDADKINFNDMSLIHGGRFEAYLPSVANWMNASHQEHRLGTNCDVRNFNIPQNRRASLVQIMLNRSGNNPADEGNHWHLRF